MHSNKGIFWWTSNLMKLQVRFMIKIINIIIKYILVANVLCLVGSILMRSVLTKSDLTGLKTLKIRSDTGRKHYFHPADYVKGKRENNLFIVLTKRSWSFLQGQAQLQFCKPCLHFLGSCLHFCNQCKLNGPVGCHEASNHFIFRKLYFMATDLSRYYEANERRRFIRWPHRTIGGIERLKK